MNSNIINAIAQISLYSLRSNFVEEVIPEENMRRLAIIAKEGLEKARSMSLELINEAIASYPPVTGDTIMLSWNWDNRKVPEIFREVCQNIWFKKIDDINIIDIIEFYIENTNIKYDEEIFRSIYQSIKAIQEFIKSYDRIKAVIKI